MKVSNKRKERTPLLQGFSYAPPLDFSFRKIQKIKDILYREARQGKRKPVKEENQEEEEKPVQEQQNQQVAQQNESTNSEQQEDEENEKQTKQKQVVEFKAPHEPEINKLHAINVVSFQSGVNKLQNEDQKQVHEEKCKIKLYTTCLILSNNYLRDVTGVVDIINQVMYHPHLLG